MAVWIVIELGIKGVNCVECKLLHCKYIASRGVDCDTNMQFGITKSAKNPDSNDLSPISISLKSYPPNSTT